MRLWLVSIVVGLSGFAGAFTFSDGDFSAWTGTFSDHAIAGGNPDAYLHWQGFIAGTPGAFSLHRSDFSYNPSVSGGLGLLNIALDGYRIESGSPSISSGIYIQQGTTTYVHPLSISADGSWQHRSEQDLTSDSFNSLFFGSGHPNFSSTGGEMSFGIIVWYVSEGYTLSGGFDNFLVSNDPVPEPISALVILSGLTGLIGRKRRRLVEQLDPLF